MAYINTIAQQSTDVAASAPTKSAATAIATMTNRGATGEFAQTLGQMIIAVGLAFGSLMAANSLSITGASMAMGYAKGTGNAAAKWAGRRTKEVGQRYSSAAFRGEKAQERAQKLQQRDYGRLSRYSGVATVGRWLGRGMESAAVQGGQGLVDDAKKRHSGKSSEQLANNMSTFRAPERLAALEILRSRGDLDKADLKKYYSESEANRFGQGKLVTDMNKALISTEAARNAAESGDMKTLDEEMGKLTSGLTKSDGGKLQQLNDVFRDFDKMKPGEKPPFGYSKEGIERWRKQFAKSVALENPGITSTVLGKLKGAQLENFQKDYNNALENEMRGLDAGSDKYKKLKERQENFRKAVINNMTGGFGEGATTTLPPSPSPGGS